MDPFAYIYTDNFIPWVVLTILAILVLMIFLGCIFSFVVAIWIFVTSGEDNAKRAKAWASIRYMILWLVFTIIFLFVFPVIFQKIWVKWYQYYSAKNIFIRSWEIVRWLTDLSNTSPKQSMIFSNPLRGGDEITNVVNKDINNWIITTTSDQLDTSL